jgi:DNA-binding response OmpR family regulator
VKRILIADDEANIVTALEFLLRRSGYEVCVARNGEDALRQIGEAPPDLVILDVMMPQRSGYDVCRRLRDREDWRHIKIVMLSAKGREEDARKGLSLGADLYMSKPFSNRELVARIDKLLREDIAPQQDDAAKL